MSSRTQRIVSSASFAAYVVAGAGLVALVTIGLSFWIGQPWVTVNDVALLVMTLALGPLMLAFYELGGRTPLRLAQAAQTFGWIAVLTWALIQALMIAGVVAFDYEIAATEAFVVWAGALVVIGLWIAGANLLAGPWLGWVRWLGAVGGIGWVGVGLGLLLVGMDHPLTYVGGLGYLVVFPVWAFLMARELRSLAVLRAA